MRSCEACRSDVPEGAAFCPSCGNRLGTAPAMRTERKIVTVLFADIKSSIDLVAYRDPEQAGDVLAEVVVIMGDAVRGHGGVVNQILGDGIMALFGAPLALEEHAAQACRAALAMRETVLERLRAEVHIRIGIGSGEVVVRALAGDVTLHYGAAGEAVHFASRMEQAAAPDQIVITAATRAAVGDLASVRSLGAIPIRGLDTPLEVFELLAMERRRARKKRRSAALLGRGPELAVLQDALDHAVAGEVGAVRVIAEAGLGKSRLVEEFTSGQLPADWALVTAEAVPHRRTSYGAVVDLLRGVFKLSAADNPWVRWDKVLTGLGMKSEAAEELIRPGLASLLGLPPAPGWQALEPRERRERTIAAASAALRQASRRCSTALVVEDAHWLDPESAQSIQRLSNGDGDSGQHLLAIVTERPPAAAFTDAHNWTPCHLTPLDGDSTRALLGGLLLPGPDVARLERMLVEHTRGNPLFIEECLEALVDMGELERIGDRFRLGHAVDRLRVPESLRALLDARVDRLPDVEKDLLQAASVLGTNVRTDLLRRVAGLDPAALDAALGRLNEAGFLVEAGSAMVDPGPRRYEFRHGLLREAAYNGILLKTRVRMHSAVLEALEERHGDDDADLLAEHASRAEAWAKAVRYARLAATRALDRYANPESARFYRQALSAVEQWPPGPEREKTQLGLHIGIRWPLFRLGQVRDLLPHLERAAALADRHDDHVQLGQSYALRSHGFWLAGRPAEAEAAAEMARLLALEKDDRDLEIRALFQLALVRLTGGRVAEVVAALDAVVAHLGPSPPRTGRYGLDADLLVTCLGYLARAHASAGSFELAHTAVQRASAVARDLDRRQAWIYVHVAHGVLMLAEGRPHGAVGHLQAAHSACLETDMRLLTPVAAGFLALAYTEAGQAARGASMAQEAVADAERMGFLALQPLRLAVLAQAHLLCGETAQAETACSAAAALAVDIEEPGAQAFATGLGGELARRRGDEAAAAALFRAARAQADRLGLRPLAASISQRIEEPDNRAHPWLDGVALAP